MGCCDRDNEAVMGIFSTLAIVFAVVIFGHFVHYFFLDGMFETKPVEVQPRQTEIRGVDN
jgi:hypothetical protein